MDPNCDAIMQFQLTVVLFQLHLVYCRAPLFFIFLFDRTDQHVVEKEILVVRLVVHDVLFDHFQTLDNFVQVQQNLRPLPLSGSSNQRLPI